MLLAGSTRASISAFAAGISSVDRSGVCSKRLLFTHLGSASVVGVDMAVPHFSFGKPFGVRVRKKKVHLSTTVPVAEVRAARINRIDRAVNVASFTDRRISFGFVAVVPVNRAPTAPFHAPKNRVSIAI